MNADRNITRIDRSTGGGYLVRVTRRGKLYREYFRDDAHDGKKKALIAARKHRDQLETSKTGFTRQQIAKKDRANNTSGVTGVRLVEETDFRWDSKPVYRYWVAQWSPKKGVRRTRRFSIDKYGYDEAYRLAVKARNAGVAGMVKQ
jgi:hypothetical protein